MTARARWTGWQIITLMVLTLGYTGFYLCRSNYAVAKPSLLAEGAEAGLDKASLGLIDSAGTICYALGKVVFGVGADFVQPKTVFVSAMIASIAATAWFALSAGKVGFLLSWCVNRSVQSAGWGALTKVASHWFAPAQYGRAMAILALSYFFGDALARLLYGELLERGMTWRGLYLVGGASLAGIALMTFVLLKRSPSAVGEPEVPVSEESVYLASGKDSRPESLVGLLGPLMRSPAFWLVCVMSAGLTFARETFNAWTPTYLAEAGGLTAGAAARYSSLFPLFGGISVLLAGWASDRAFGGRRGAVMVLMLTPAVCCLVVLAAGSSDASGWVPLACISGAALGMLGPYAFLSGAIALDIGSRKGSATAVGLVDAAGYFAGAMAGAPIAALAQSAGWNAAFGVLAGVVAFTLGAAAAYWWIRDRARA